MLEGGFGVRQVWSCCGQPRAEVCSAALRVAVLSHAGEWEKEYGPCDWTGRATITERWDCCGCDSYNLPCTEVRRREWEVTKSLGSSKEEEEAESEALAGLEGSIDRQRGSLPPLTLVADLTAFINDTITDGLHPDTPSEDVTACLQAVHALQAALRRLER
eukprot:PLAT11248.2.p3 GENE.PLAT11248.2~~PLAT11248.2.p3  ORF type:complete len:161 (+),score=38.90 PLAT11248.2:231-713(+)